jgi:hypothetical protein
VTGEPSTTLVYVNLHDWIDELCDALDIEVEIDESLVLDVAREAAHNVERVAAPISTFLLGYAAGESGGGPERLERLAGVAIALAEGWDGREEEEFEDVPVDEADPDLVDVE